MSILYSDVEKHFNKNKKAFKSLLTGIEDLLIEGRDEDNVPIYLTKWRIKKKDSLYLKTKRFNKIKNLDDITDYAGLRILCLFEDDIFTIHKYLIQTLCKERYDVREFKIYNWPNEVYIQLLKSTAKEKFNKIKISSSIKPSGYKSLHYIVWANIRGKAYPIEVQLRTLLQDVWGELEHTLSYKKGNIHPHIKKSFSLLARDLETSDMLLTHLKEISEKQICTEEFFVTKARPRNYFYYEEELIPDSFKQEKIKSLWEKYSNPINDKELKNSETKWLSKARNCFTELDNELIQLKKTDNKVKYILDVEEAFLLFSEREYDKALNIYKNLLEEYKDHYVIHFRRGEIFFIKGKIEEALSCFDNAEQILSNTNSNYLNKYIVKLRLAYTYWSLGHEYIDTAIKEISESKKIYDKFLLETNGDDFNLLNNMGWYHLEKYIINKNIMAQKTNKEEREKFLIALEESFKLAEEKCFQVEAVLEKNPTSHMYDTVSYFYYQKYLKNKKELDLEKARNYCSNMHDTVDYTSFTFKSWDIRMNHIQQIMRGQ